MQASIFKLKQASRPNLRDGEYINRMVPLQAFEEIAGISSQDSLVIFNAQTLQTNASAYTRNAHNGMTCLVSSAAQLLTAGRDATVKTWDLKSPICTSKLTHGSRPYFALAASSDNHLIATGTELEEHEAQVIIWDIRQISTPLGVYKDLHNDDITELQFHPTRHNLLLSGSTDGLLNVIDTNVHLEEDTVISTTNHGSSIFRAGWLSDKEVFALSHDEIFSVHDIDPDTAPGNEEGQKGHERGVDFGDLRERLGAAYIADITLTSTGLYIAAGITKSAGTLAVPRLDIFELNLEPLEGGMVYILSRFAKHHFATTHGDEVVRSMLYHNNMYWTAGEDCTVKLWLPGEASLAGSEHSALAEHSAPGKIRKDKRRAAVGAKPY